VRAATVQRRVDPVPEHVGLGIGEGALEMAQDDSDDDVLLAGRHAHAVDRCDGESITGSLLTDDAGHQRVDQQAGRQPAVCALSTGKYDLTVGQMWNQRSRWSCSSMTSEAGR
jgi:hypothetical protein